MNPRSTGKQCQASNVAAHYHSLAHDIYESGVVYLMRQTVDNSLIVNNAVGDFKVFSWW
jgi:hypothetical protein